MIVPPPRPAWTALACLVVAAVVVQAASPLAVAGAGVDGAVGVAAGGTGSTSAGAIVPPPAPFLPATEIVALVVTGLGAGVLGGLLGIGGSVIMIPVLTLGFHHDQHLSQAAAMIVNVVVAVAAFSQHRRRGAVPWEIVRRMIPAAVVAIVAGVAASNVMEGTALKQVFGVFMVVVVAIEVQRLLRIRGERARARRTRAITTASASATAPPSAPTPGTERSEPAIDVGGDDEEDGPARPPGTAAVITVATITGFLAGLLGVGGGTIAVPLCQRVLGLPLRWCIGTSATLMCLTAPVGAIAKTFTLGRVPGDAGTPIESLAIAGVLAPTAILGSILGARLTHVLPVPWVRAILIFLLTWAALEFLGLT